MSMFCYQCEQTAKGTGCTSYGVCGKDPEVAGLQDLTLHLLKGVAMYAHRARKLGATSDKLGKALLDGLFYTVTNVNFDAQDFVVAIKNLNSALREARDLYEGACKRAGKTPEQLGSPATFEVAADKNAMLKQAWDVSIEKRIERHGADLAGLQELLVYGLKGAGAYAHHAAVMGATVPGFAEHVEEVLNYLGEDKPAVPELLGLSLECGKQNLNVMAALDSAHTARFGHPVPTPVRVTPVKGKCILVSGHDLPDLESLLIATEGKGINIYTHGEMLPAHGYPNLKKYRHLVGNYGSAWQNQAREFDAFPGSILMTTNCIQRPLDSYKSRIFTTGLVGWPGVTHLPNGKWDKVIAAALEAPGFAQDEAEKTILVGFGHNAVLGVADKVVEAVKSGAIRHFFLIGGCDGAKTGRDYYTNLADALPKDTVILTLACGKYRFNMHEFGDIGGIPRLLDVGQCNDAYSAIRIAVALADAFKTDVNSLPLSMVLSWYEQKAVAILLTLLHLGIRNIRLGPTLPAFVTPTVLNVLVEKFAIKPIGTVEGDMKAILGG